MPDECKEILDSIENNNRIIKDLISKKDEEIKNLKEALDLSEVGRQTAENMVSQIKGEANIKLREAYNSGYNAALVNPNPTGGTTIEQNNDKRLVLSNTN